MAATIASIFGYLYAALYIFSGAWYFKPKAQRLWNQLASIWRKTEVDRLQACLDSANDYEQWLEYAQALDEHISENRLWKLDPKSKLYHWEQISTRLSDIEKVMLSQDTAEAFDLLSFGMVRGLGNVTDPKLYNRVYTGTKTLIETYINAMLKLMDHYFERPWNGKALPLQAKVDTAESFRIAFGKTALILQGGSVFGLYHIGVMKGLHEQRLLPRNILGTGTGAIIAAIAGVHTEEELPELLSGKGINLDAFADRSHETSPTWYDIFLIFLRRLNRFYASGYVLDREALERCVEDNVGDMTFKEARERTGRAISITIECDSPGTPNLLNFWTTPNVLIRTAAMASNESDPDIAPAMIRQKNRQGEILPWSLNDESPAFRAIRRKRMRRRPIKDVINAPLQRISQLENINHFVISQARPYLVPFLSSSLHRSNRPRSTRAGFWSFTPIKNWMIRFAGKEITHRMNQTDRLIGLPRRVQRFLMEERMPFRSITMVPEVKWKDFIRLLRNPTQDEIDHWIALGERSVWPCVSALEVRCSIEFDLENRYKLGKRRPIHEIYAQEREIAVPLQRKPRVRSVSMESNPY